MSSQISNKLTNGVFTSLVPINREYILQNIKNKAFNTADYYTMDNFDDMSENDLKNLIFLGEVHNGKQHCFQLEPLLDLLKRATNLLQIDHPILKTKFRSYDIVLILNKAYRAGKIQLIEYRRYLSKYNLQDLADIVLIYDSLYAREPFTNEQGDYISKECIESTRNEAFNLIQEANKECDRFNARRQEREQINRNMRADVAGRFSADL